MVASFRDTRPASHESRYSKPSGDEHQHQNKRCCPPADEQDDDLNDWAKLPHNRQAAEHFARNRKAYRDKSHGDPHFSDFAHAPILPRDLDDCKQSSPAETFAANGTEREPAHQMIRSMRNTK
jgi:hypothetical protein